MKCPRDQAPLVSNTYEADIQVESCPQCGGMWLDRGELEAALELLSRSAAASPHARLHVRRGDLLAQAARTAEALAAYEAALELRPTDAQIAERIERCRQALEGGDGR